VFQTTVYVDLGRATLGDVVEQFVRLELGYGDRDFVVNNESVILYDADETQNLPSKLRDLGIGPDTALTIIDEDDDEPFVDVRVNIQEASEPLEGKPIKVTFSRAKLEVPRKPMDEQPVAETNGVTVNGKHAPAVKDAEPTRGVKRPRDDEVAPANPKKAKVTAADEVIIVDDDEDPAGGQIVIDDD
jgi:ubiquitin-like 1-activating enzyme E1 B